MKSFLLSCYPKQSCHPKFILLDFARPSFFGLKDRRIYLRSKSERMFFIPFGTFGSKSTAKLPAGNCVTCFGKLNPSG